MVYYQLAKLSLHHHKTNVKKVYLVSVFKSQENLLCNQYSDQSDRSLQKVQISLPYLPLGQGTMIKFAG